jgi:hypothetical protein
MNDYPVEVEAIPRRQNKERQDILMFSAEFVRKVEGVLEA